MGHIFLLLYMSSILCLTWWFILCRISGLCLPPQRLSIFVLSRIFNKIWFYTLLWPISFLFLFSFSFFHFFFLSLSLSALSSIKNIVLTLITWPFETWSEWSAAYLDLMLIVKAKFPSFFNMSWPLKSLFWSQAPSSCSLLDFMGVLPYTCAASPSDK